MAKYINISKHSEINNLFVYFVSGDFGPTFYMSIDPIKKLIYFYKNEDFTQSPLGIINLNFEPPLKDIPGLDEDDVGMAAMQAAIAIHKNEFPDYIGFSS